MGSRVGKPGTDCSNPWARKDRFIKVPFFSKLVSAGIITSAKLDVVSVSAKIDYGDTK